jgi:ubiquinone/menaquinone biosynthesis C-methylase UbiE
MIWRRVGSVTQKIRKRNAAVPRTTVPLRDLGEINPQWRGILSPGYGDALINSFLQAQFQEDAAVYARRYQFTEHWKHLLVASQRYYRVEDLAPTILDIGSGAGNSVFPLLDLYPDARIVASDLSVPLLKILKDYLDQHFAHRRCVVVQLNAENLVFQDAQFDLVVGGSILHHLFAPDRTIRDCFRVLKPGGVAVFFEPFETGNQVLALGLKHLADLSRNPPDGGAPIEPHVLEFFAAVCKDYRCRKGVDKSAAFWKYLDDKWLFTRSYFEGVARDAGFRRVTIYPNNPFEDNLAPFSNQVGVLLRLGLQRDLDALPGWAREYLAEMDGHFSRELCQELILEGTIILRK